MSASMPVSVGSEGRFSAQALLCESCGYPLEGLLEGHAKEAGEGSAGAVGTDGHAGGHCPECGLEIAKSLPSARTGSAWQHRKDPVFPAKYGKWYLRLLVQFVGPWLATNYDALRRPAELFRSLRIEARGGTGLLLLNLTLTAFVIVDPWVGVLLFDPTRRARSVGVVAEWATRAGMLVFEMLVVGGLFLLLTWVEYRGVRFFAKRRGWRLTPEAAWQVCCHASVGWVLAGLLPLLGMALLFIGVYWFGYSPKGVIDLSKLFGPSLPLIHVNAVVMWTLTLGGGLVGLLVYESLVYVGVRQCKFAATVGTQAETAPSAAASPPGVFAER